MSTKASADFGLYKEKQKQNRIKSLKYVLGVVAIAIGLLGILYAILHLLNNIKTKDAMLEATLERPQDNLQPAETAMTEALVNSPPKPFGVTYRGQPPAEFTSTTEKITTLNYPQLTQYRHRHYPKSIQDIIGYGNRHQRPADLLKYNRIYKEAPSQHIATKNFSYNENDPFYLYKPQDPSDINLLATASVRFAPPIWSNLKSTYPKLQHPLQDNSNRQEIYNTQLQKPLTVTLNIYPNDDSVHPEHKNGIRSYLSHKLENLQSRIRFPDSGKQPRKMVIHLNLYPEPVVGLGESKVHKNVVSTPSAAT